MATQNIVFLVIFIIFLAFLFISSFVAKNWVKETDDYVLAGRQISTGMNIFGVIAIGFAGTTMALAPGFAIQFGFKGSFLWSAIYSFCGLAFYGLLYSNFVRRCGAQTLPEFLEMRYDGKTRSVIAITSVVGMLGIMQTTLYPPSQISVHTQAGIKPLLLLLFSQLSCFYIHFRYVGNFHD